MRRVLTLIACAVMTTSALAQSPIQFNGYGRGWIENNYLPQSDTVNIDQTNKGHTLLDINLDINPNDKIRINAILRMRNELGGFWGEGQLVDLRQIYVKGVAGDIVKYQFGDINLKLTPYTMFNSSGDGSVNEASVFGLIRNVAEYENFNNENFWRVQGGHTAFKLGFDKGVDALGLQAFMTRNKRVEGSSIIPDRMYGGAAAKLTVNEGFDVGVNYVSLFDITGSAFDYEESYANNVATVDLNLELGEGGLYLFGEAGMSTTQKDSAQEAKVDIDGNFFELGAGVKSENGKWDLKASFRNVDDEFFSAGAQTKRINFNGTPATMANVNSSSAVRNVSLLDITRDYSIYNKGMAQELMSFDPRLNNVTPYGKATPNRRGLSAELNYTSDSSETMTSFAKADLLTEHVGEGTPNKRNFALVTVGGNLKAGQLAGWKRNVNLSLGYQLGITSRGLTEEESLSGVDAVDYTTHLLDAGFDIELFKRFDFLAGVKVVTANGTEYLSERDEFNEITGYDKVSEQFESLYAAGFRYRFNENINLTIQGHSFTAEGTSASYNNALVTIDDYNIKQVFVLFNMHF